MPVRHCIAVECTSDSRKDKDVIFYDLPKVESSLKNWLNLVRREGLSVDPTLDNRHNVVCSKHFVDGRPTFENPLPTLFAYNNYKQKTPRKTKNSHQGRTTEEKCTANDQPIRKKVKLVKCFSEKCYHYVAGEIDVSDNVTDENNNEKETGEVCSAFEMVQDHNYTCHNPDLKYCREEELIQRVSVLETECEELRKENKRLWEENERLKARKVILREELLKKLVIKWPSSATVKKHMPLSFQLKYPNTTSIIDCTEIFIQKPKNCSAQASTWSNYKSHNTLKALVAIQPNGAFTFVSKLWSGNISDRKITIDSKYIDNICPGDEVMADRGFQIRDLLTLKGAYLNMPPFTRERRNGVGRVLTSKQIIETRKISSLRIHVERAIRRLKSFRLLRGILPLKMKNLSSAMLRVAAAF
ncbi:uncharacterized protein LOC134282753 [Saccostrea cucullata]|uniref:uncharacterized protein LOC134282753 n=1 Tax=Saccostrea cuccullata TaxID=36930 RepID=UPI002ED352E7